MTQRIAVVEDEPMMNDLICFVLNNAGFKTVSYTSARAAQAGLNRQFDLWLLDIMLETPTAGLDLMKAVREVNPRGTASWIRLPVWKLAAMTTLPSRFPKKNWYCGLLTYCAEPHRRPQRRLRQNYCRLGG